MLTELKKYTRTYEWFETYMGKFDFEENNWDAEEFLFDPEEISHGRDRMKMPEQFLLGCLMEFTLENGGYVPAFQWLITKRLTGLNAFNMEKQIVIKAFEIMEEKST